MRSDIRHNRAELFTGANCDSPLITSDPYYPHLLVWSQFRGDSRARRGSDSCLPLLSHKLLKTTPALKNPLLFQTTANKQNSHRFWLLRYKRDNLNSTKEIVILLLHLAEENSQIRHFDFVNFKTFDNLSFQSNQKYIAATRTRCCFSGCWSILD